jgi:xanthine dehydrogenase accessory factor
MTLSDRIETERDRLIREGRPFALATVVRTLDATSAKPGAKALVAEDGTILEGWIGGACARGAVGRAGAEAIATGAPVLVSLRPEDLLEAEGAAPGEDRHGQRFARNGCPSRGSMDIFVEPVLPRPRLIVFGASPVAVALSELAGSFGFHRTLAAPGLTTGPADAVQDGFVLEAGRPEGRFIVVATQGKGDEAGLRAAMASGAGHIAFVGSRRKFATLAARLAAEGVPSEALERVRAPAGLDIRAITPEEIALSILAEIVLIRRGGPREAAPAPKPGLLARLMPRLTDEQAQLMAGVRKPCC